MDNDSQYFHSYEDLEIHKLMLDDYPRTEAFRKSILDNKKFFKNKTVMDVGCGTGILSVFAAQAGAKKVYAIEATNLAEIAKEVAQENDFESVIKVFQCKVEEFEMPEEGEKVDIIISEWMGFYLLHEGMLDSVLFARDKFMKPGGEIFPSGAVIYVAPCRLPKEYNRDWNKVHGVKMQSFAKPLRETKSSKPEVTIINMEDVIGIEDAICWIDLKEDKPEHFDHISFTNVIASRNDGLFQGFVIWFAVMFPDIHRKEPKVILETSPFTEPTHWKQTVLILPNDQTVQNGQPLAYKIDLKRNPNNSRRYTIELTMLDPENTEHPLPCPCYMTRCLVTSAFMDEHPVIQNGNEEDEEGYYVNDAETQTDSH